MFSEEHRKLIDAKAEKFLGKSKKLYNLENLSHIDKISYKPPEI